MSGAESLEQPLSVDSEAVEKASAAGAHQILLAAAPGRVRGIPGVFLPPMRSEWPTSPTATSGGYAWFSLRDAGSRIGQPRTRMGKQWWHPVRPEAHFL